MSNDMNCTTTTIRVSDPACFFFWDCVLSEIPSWTRSGATLQRYIPLSVNQCNPRAIYIYLSIQICNLEVDVVLNEMQSIFGFIAFSGVEAIFKGYYQSHRAVVQPNAEASVFYFRDRLLPLYLTFKEEKTIHQLIEQCLYY